MTTMPVHMKSYLKRLFAFMTLYTVILFAGMTWMNSDNPPGQEIAALFAIASALPIIGVFWTIFRLLVEMEDEYQRLLMTKQILLGTAITLAIATIWQFLNAYDVVETGPQWISAIWLAMWGIAGGIVRWKA